jgi:hypothetical protein
MWSTVTVVPVQAVHVAEPGKTATVFPLHAEHPVRSELLVVPAGQAEICPFE